MKMRRKIVNRRIWPALVVLTALFEFSGNSRVTATGLLRPEVGTMSISVPKTDGTVDVMVEVTSVTENVTNDPNDRSKKKTLTSGVFDLRLFRDGQLVNTSTPKSATEKYISMAPEAVEKDRISKVLLNTEEDKLWREANDMSKVVKFDAAGKATFTFRGIKLPRNGRNEVEFSAYAFNIDRVKSNTVRTMFKIERPETRQGRAYVVSIGVNASENKRFDLKYAANDARKMQAVLREKLTKERYSEIIAVPIISDRKTDEFADVNNARKSVIKGVFAMLAGAGIGDAAADIAKTDKALAAAFEKNPDIQRIRPVEPEDTLIVTYAGHGYADRSGIFYLLPFDIGSDTSELKTSSIHRMISSDELSLWMQDITAVEMIMVIDACHSASAVQGDGFKPGPMGSRGLGQLAYDKGMLILSATQADNVALELNSLKHGLLTFALIQDGVVEKKADTGDKPDGKLTASEWLNYAVIAVPKLFQDVLDGKRDIVIDGKPVNIGKPGADRDTFQLEEGKKAEKTVQTPNVFDFRKSKIEPPLLVLR